MIEYKSFIKTDLKKSRFEKIALFVLGKDKDLSVTLVGRKRMRTLNKRYRDIDKPTDVLSFVSPEGFPDLGDIIICPAETENINEIFIHGLLHLLGYSHDTQKNAKILERKQKKYLKLCQEII